MTKQQKRILLILGLSNVLVIGLLGSVVIMSSRSVTPPPSGPAQIPQCPQSVLAVLPPTDSRSISWNENLLQLTIRVHYASDTPPPESVQYLWMALDSIAAALQNGCAPPQTINIAVTAQADTATYRHQVQISGTVVAAWANGELNEADLATAAKYRYTIP